MTLTDEILSLLPPGHPWGQRIIHLNTTDSTNTYAKALAQQGAPGGTVIIADQQTGGRGRLGRSFASPGGLGLYLSLILRPDCFPEEMMHLTCAVAVAASNAVARSAGIAPDIKWTNDLVVGKRKLGGILTELNIDPATKQVAYAIIGIGINCSQKPEDFPEEIRQIATSVLLCAGDSSRAKLAAALMEELFQLEQDLLPQKEALMAAFSRRCVTIGQDISIIRGDEVQHGKALAVDNNGALIVSYPDGHCAPVSSGEVSIRGMYGYL